MSSADVAMIKSQAPDQKVDPNKQQQQDQTGSGTDEPQQINGKNVIATKVNGTVKWFNVKNGYGFIHRKDVNEDIFIHQTAIIKNNPQKYLRSVEENEEVEFDIVRGEKGLEAANVTGPNGSSVKGSKYAADRRQYNTRDGPREYRPPMRGYRRPYRGGIDSGYNRPFDGAYGPPPPMVGRPPYGRPPYGRPPYSRPPRGMDGPMFRGGRPPFRGDYEYDGEFPSQGPRIFRGRGVPMFGGPMGPIPGPMGPPFGFRGRGGPRGAFRGRRGGRGRYIRGYHQGNRENQHDNNNENDQTDEQDADQSNQ